MEGGTVFTSIVAGTYKYIDSEAKDGRVLDRALVSEIVKTVEPFVSKINWKQFASAMSSYLAKANVSGASISSVILNLCIQVDSATGDECLRAADGGYGNGQNGLELREVMIEACLERGDDIEDALDKSLEAVDRLGLLLGFPVDSRIVVEPVETGSQFKAFVNDPKRGILYVSKRSRSVSRRYVLGYYVDKVTVLVNPSDERDVTYSLVLRHPRTGETLRYEEEYIGGIVSDIENTKRGVGDRNKLKEALSTIINAFVTRGLAKYRNRVPATGFFEVNGELKWFETHRFKVNLGGVDRDKTVMALRTLEELLGFYKYSDKALAALYYGIQAPLGFVRKKHGRENRILFLYGEPHTGKTSLMKIIGYIWGMREDQSVVSAAKITTPQLAERMNETTLLVTLDEVRTILVQSDLVDMLKSSTTNIHVKSRILPHLGYRRIEFHAYSSIAMTTNYVPQLLPGVEERLILLEWTVEDKRSEEEVERFLQKLAESKDVLPHIGSYLREMYVRRWREVREIIMDTDQLRIGRRLLEMLYEDLGLPRPGWMVDVNPRYEIETPTPEDLLFDTIREDLIKAIGEARIVREVKKTADGLVEMDRELSKLNWLERLHLLADAGFLPSYMKLGKRNVYIKTSIVERIRRRTGYEIPGGLRNLALKLGYKYESKDGKRSMWIPVGDLIDKLNQEVQDDEES